METDDLISDVKEPLASRAGESSARSPQFDPGFVARLIDHEKRIQNLESRTKVPATVIDDLETAILQMNREHLEDLDKMLSRSVHRLSSAQAKVQQILTVGRPTEGNDN